MKGRQLTLDLGFRPALGREDFFVAASNREAVGWIDRWPEWPAPGLLVHGPAGCGKTHLAHVFQARAGAHLIALPALHDVPEGIAPLVVEDADRGVDEEALLHLYNAAHEARRALFLTARQPAARWGLRLPDLRSRLVAMPAVGIAPPDDDLLARVLVKHFSDRQVTVDDEVIGYLLVRMERSFEAARDIAEALDAVALAEGRAISVALVREVLAKLEGRNAAGRGR